MFNIGDEVEVISGEHHHTKPGARGIITTVHGHSISVDFYYDTLYDKHILSPPKTINFSINRGHLSLIKDLLSNEARVISKIKHLQTKFEVRKEMKNVKGNPVRVQDGEQVRQTTIIEPRNGARPIFWRI